MRLLNGLVVRDLQIRVLLGGQPAEAIRADVRVAVDRFPLLTGGGPEPGADREDA